jgi:2-polyprenyl-3-methyl-5-hydroxy-6-metoxy-1,4-benzoquinol methylase
LIETFVAKHGNPRVTGAAPSRRYRFGYFTPDDVYETVVAGLVSEGCSWLDVGGGRDVFPTNPALARRLAARCGRLVGVDPDDNIWANPFVHERAQATVEEYHSDRPFDLATLRMVAEHITDPPAAVAALARLVRPGGKVVLFTVNWWSPITLCSWAVPFHLHHTVKRVLWKTEERDTFPTAYRMNTRGRLAQLFRAGDFREVGFAYLDDCRTFGRFGLLNFLELAAWRLLHGLGLHYPETCLLGVYERLSGLPARRTGPDSPGPREGTWPTN